MAPPGSPGPEGFRQILMRLQNGVAESLSSSTSSPRHKGRVKLAGHQARPFLGLLKGSEMRWIIDRAFSLLLPHINKTSITIRS